MDSLSSSGRSATPVFDKVVRPSTDERVPPVEPHVPPTQSNRSFETNIPDSNSVNNADLYGTLPRWKTQKSQDHVRQCNNQKLESEVYHDFLENQRRQTDSVNHSRTGSGARTPVNELNSDLVNAPNKRYENTVQTQQVNRPYPDSSTGFKYSRMTQGLKPIPVSPPKIEKQSQHAEVDTQSVKQLDGFVSAGRFHSPSENGGTEHGNCDVRRLNNGDYPTPGAKPSSRAFNSTLASFIRTKSSKSVADKHVSSSPATHPRRLQCASINQCEPALAQLPLADPGLAYDEPGRGRRDPCRSRVSGQMLNRSASLSRLARPAAYSQSSPYSGTNTYPIGSP